MPRSVATPVLTVRTGDGRTFRFSRPFQIGRERDCDVQIDDPSVSRRHVLVSCGNSRWLLRDQHSGNGVFVDGRRIDSIAIESLLTIRLGPTGPFIELLLESADATSLPPDAEPEAANQTIAVARRYFGQVNGEEPVGGRTMMIRKAFQQVQRRQRRLYLIAVGALSIIALIAAMVASYGRRQIARQQAIAEGFFYDMKAQDVEIANLEQKLASNDTQRQALVKTYLERRRQMEMNYEQYVSGLKFYDHVLTPQEQLILRVTRILGECDMAAPPDYLAEVRTYIRKWQSTPSYEAGVRRALEKGYAKRIVEELQRQDLPIQFFYLALQESGFDEVASGRQTRFGIAKGMWQFVPETARRYGLSTGPLVAFGRPDPADERHQWEKATRAAAAYIKDIYAMDAQASGLLVMASYNWGENRVLNLIRTMPANPRERNFWKVLGRYRERVPPETYDYVLKIVSAAVIGENPKLFGFTFDNPLAFAEGAGVTD